MFSLYRGELHNVSGVPRQWSIPKSQIPVSVFKKALVKRNAALSKLSQASSSGQRATDSAVPPAAPTANGTGGHHTSESGDDSGDFEERDGAENSSDSEADSRAENAVGYTERNVAASNEETKAVAEERGRRRERKRRREQDLRDETGRCVHRKEGLASADASELDASELEQRANFHGAEPMVVDDVDQSGAMECDATVSEKAVTDTDEANAEKVRVRVPEEGDVSELDAMQADPGTGDTREPKQKDVEHPRRNGEVSHPKGAGADLSGSEKLSADAGQIVPATAVQNGGTGAADVDMKDAEPNRKADLEAKLEKLRAEKHRFVLRLKRVLNEEETKKRESLASASPKSHQGTPSGHNDTPGVTSQVEGHGGGGARASADLEDGELEYARTPSPPSRNVHGGATGSHNSLGPSPMAAGTARQGFLQHSSQSTTARGGYYIPNVGVSPSTSAAVGAGGTLSPSLPSPSGSRPYSHNLGMQQHAAAMYGQKVSSGAHGHAQFNAMQSSGAHVGVTPPGVAGGPPGFSGYPMTSSVHSHHSHHSHQQASSPHIAAGQQVVSSSPLLSNPRGPPSYHDVRMGGGAWIQR